MGQRQEASQAAIEMMLAQTREVAVVTERWVVGDISGDKASKIGR